AVQVRGEVGAHGAAVLLAHVLGPVLRVQARHFVGQLGDLFGGKQGGEEQIPVPVELLELRVGQLHRCLRETGPAGAGFWNVRRRAPVSKTGCCTGRGWPPAGRWTLQAAARCASRGMSPSAARTAWSRDRLAARSHAPALMAW